MVLWRSPDLFGLMETATNSGSGALGGSGELAAWPKSVPAMSNPARIRVMSFNKMTNALLTACRIS
jgi:hypothetical protein